MEAKSNSLHFLTSNDWALIRDKSRELKFHKDQWIIQEGLIGSTLYVLKSGRARVERVSASKSVRIATLEPGDVCGEMAFIEKGKASASVVADEDVTAEALDTATLSTLFESFPHVGARFFRSLALILSQRLRTTSAELAKARATIDPRSRSTANPPP